MKTFAPEGSVHFVADREHSLGWPAVLLVVALALGYRALYFTVAGKDPLSLIPVIDGSYHDEWARRIVAGDLFGHGPDDVFKPPLYAYFIALLYAVFGRSIALIQWIQYGLGAASCAMAGALAARFLGRRAGITVGILSSLYAPYIFFESQLLAPAPGIFLNLAALLVLTGSRVGNLRGRAFAGGVLFGLSAAMRPDVLLPAGLAAAYALWHFGGGGRRKAAVRAGLAVAGSVLVLLPITIRNAALTGSFIPVCSYGGINFYTGNSVSADGISAVPVGLRWERLISRVPQDILERPAAAEHWWVKRAWEEIVAQPGAAAARFARKAVAFFNAREFRNNICFHFMQERAWPLRFPFLQYAIVLPIAVSGLIFLWRMPDSARQLAVLVSLWSAGFLIVGMLFFVTARYRLPVVPILMIPAGWALTESVSRLRSRRWRMPAGMLLIAAAVGLLVWPSWFGRPRKNWALDYVNLGNCLKSTAHPEAATAAYQEALKIGDDPDAHYLLGRQLLLENDLRNAIVHLEAAHRSIPDSPEVLLTLAQARLSTGDLISARGLLEKLVELSNRSNLWPVRAKWATACILLADLKPLSADALWKQAWSIHPTTAAEASFLRGRNMPLVLETFRRDAMDQPWDWYSQANYGMVLLTSGRATEAAGLLRRASRLAPEKERLRFQLARALTQSGDKAGATAIVEDLLRTLPYGKLRRDVEVLRMQLR